MLQTTGTPWTAHIVELGGTFGVVLSDRPDWDWDDDSPTFSFPSLRDARRYVTGLDVAAVVERLDPDGP
jgi:hypothetical protein